MSDIANLPPAAAEMLRAAHAEALAAGFEDPIWGAAVILARALAGLEDAVSTKLRRIAVSG